ncbi:hypothetical protein ACFRMQ_21290, partial [Kitasatospora sp. NPDC056783]|uniref:hypothetical protein n=1 Tax=Kitasatospora sp. NPDC056783 TaxID=3345943 RepID=UPI0036A270A5
MAGRTRYSVAPLSRAAGGQQLPSLPVALAYVEACGGDPEEAERAAPPRGPVHEGGVPVDGGQSLDGLRQQGDGVVSAARAAGPATG